MLVGDSVFALFLRALLIWDPGVKIGLNISRPLAILSLLLIIKDPSASFGGCVYRSYLLISAFVIGSAGHWCLGGSTLALRFGLHTKGEYKEL